MSLFAIPTPVLPAERDFPAQTAMPITRVSRLRNAGVAAFCSLREMTGREKEYLLGEIRKINGLMPLLMKPRNGERWTPEEREELRMRLRSLSNISSYLVVLALPASFLILPALAWWLDRRRNRRGSAEKAPL